MTVYTAILLACAIVSPAPAGCTTHEMRFEAAAVPYAAVVEGQNRAAQWLTEHPGLKPVKLTIKAGIGV